MAKTIEVDELDYTNKQSLQTTIQGILKNPKAALLLEQAHKLVDDKAPTPRLDSQKERDDRYDALKKEFDEYKQAQRDSRDKEESERKLLELNSLVEKGNAKLLSEGWTTDGIKALDEFRQKKGILDPLDAAGAYERQFGPQVQAPATPSSGIGGWNFAENTAAEGQEGYAEKLLKTRGEQDSLVMGEAMKAVRDFRSQFGGRR